MADRLQRIGQQLDTALDQTEELPAPASRKPARRRPLAAAVGVLALLVAAAVFFLQTPNGTIRIEINDDSIEAILTNNGAVIKGADKAHDITVAAGEQGLTIKRGDMEFETDKFTLMKNEKVVVKVEFLKGQLQVVQNDKVLNEKKMDRPNVAGGGPGPSAAGGAWKPSVR